MSQIIYTEDFLNDFDYLYHFLNEKNPLAAHRFANLLDKKMNLLSSIPETFSFLGDYRVYFLSFGSSGYTISYHYDENIDSLILLRIKHQKEAGF